MTGDAAHHAASRRYEAGHLQQTSPMRFFSTDRNTDDFDTIFGCAPAKFLKGRSENRDSMSSIAQRRGNMKRSRGSSSSDWRILIIDQEEASHCLGRTPVTDCPVISLICPT